MFSSSVTTNQSTGDSINIRTHCCSQEFKQTAKTCTIFNILRQLQGHSSYTTIRSPRMTATVALLRLTANCMRKSIDRHILIILLQCTTNYLPPPLTHPRIMLAMYEFAECDVFKPASQTAPHFHVGKSPSSKHTRSIIQLCQRLREALKVLHGDNSV